MWPTLISLLGYLWVHAVFIFYIFYLIIKCFVKCVYIFRKLLIYSCCWLTFNTTSWTWGAFHSTKTSETFKTGANSMEMSLENFQKIKKLLIS